MKIRNVVWDETTNTNRIVWFGSIGALNMDGKDTKHRKHPNYIEVRGLDIEAIKEYKRVEIINCLSVFRGEIKTDISFGVRGLFEKASKDLIDIEIIDLLRHKLGLIVNKFESNQIDREYKLYFEVTTPEGVELEMTYNYNFIV